MPVTTIPTTVEAGEASPRRRPKKGFLVIVVVVVATLFGAGWFLLRPASSPAAPEPGEVMALEPIQVNLSGGHYLRIGIALQLTADAEESEGSKALDATIELFSGRSMDQLALPEQREELKHELLEQLVEDYEGDVMGVYFTDFVTQ